MTQRALFVCSANSVPVLQHGETDCSKIVATLTDPRFGGSDLVIPGGPLIQCPTAGDFLKALGDFVVATRDAAQRILYFTGHGRWERHEFAFEFSGSQSVPFNVVAGLLAPSGAARTLLIIDSCHSGGAAVGGLKSNPTFPVSPGSCVLSSCKSIELSREVPEHGSLFTHYFCEGIETGLGGRKTPLARISVTDILGYVREKLEERDDSAPTRQTPTYSVSQGEEPIWIATNISGALVDGAGASRRALDSDPLALPPEGAVYADLDEMAILAVAKRDPLGPPTAFAAAQQMGLLYAQDDDRPSAAAILCFGKAPQRFFPEVASVFSSGDKSEGQLVSEQIEGTLMDQFGRLIELLLRHLDRRSTFAETGLRSDEYEIDPSVLREVVANALTHRDFAGRGRVQVHIDENHVEILNPGAFPDGHDWESLLERPGKSLTDNRRVANFLNKLGTVEGLGRGFHVLKAFRTRYGEGAIRFEQAGGVVACYIRRPARPALEPPSTAMQTIDRQAQQQLLQALELQTRSLGHVQLLGQPFALNDIFVAPSIRDDDGQQLDHATLLDRVRKRRGYRAVLVGAAGMGKSTLFQKLALDIKDRASADSAADGRREQKAGAVVGSTEQPLVIHVALRNLDISLPLIVAIGQDLGTFPTALDQALRERPAVLLLDGFDEVAPAQRAMAADHVAMLASDYPHLTMLVSSRPTDSVAQLLPGSDTLSLIPFTRDQALRMTDLGAPGTRARMIQHLPEDSALLANPLLSQIAALIFDQYAELPGSRRQIMHQFVDYMLRRHDATKGQFQRTMTLEPEAMRETIEVMALMMLARGTSALSETDARRLVSSALHFTSNGHTVGEDAALLREILEFGFFIQTEGTHIAPFNRSIVEELAIEGAVKALPDPEGFARLLTVVLGQNGSLQLADDFIEAWVKDRGQAELLINLLQRRAHEEPGEIRLLLERLITDLSEKLHRYRSAPGDLFDLIEK